MKFTSEITFSFSEDVLKEVVAEHIKTTTGYEVNTKDIHFSVRSRTEGYGVGEHPVYYLEGCTAKLCTEGIPVKTNEENNKTVKTAKWKYWPGWSGNHDRRIDDAVCSNCGYEHPTVRGSNELLADVCPKCKCSMDKGGVD